MAFLQGFAFHGPELRKGSINHRWLVLFRPEDKETEKQAE